MIILLNIVFALLAGWLTQYVAIRAGAAQPIALILAVIVGIIVYLVNIAGQIL